MKPFKYQRLYNALLLEIASGFYQEGKRFLSYRKVCKAWNVSQATAESALEALVRHGILEIRPRVGYLLVPGFRRVALALLNQRSTFDPLPSVPNWISRRARLVADRPRHLVAVLFDVPPRKKGGIASALLETPSLGTSVACARGCSQRAEGSQCELEFYQFSADETSIKALAAHLESRHFNGIIFFRRREMGWIKEMLESLVAHRIPVISVFNECRGTDAFVVDFNNIGAGYNAAERFLAAGIRRLAVLNPGYRQPNYLERVEGFRLGVEAFGSGEVEFLSLKGTTFRQERLHRWLRGARETRSGLFLTGHYPLDRLMPLTTRMRLRIPRDLAVIMTSSRSVFPSIQREFDVLRLDFEAVGAKAVDLMCAVLAGEAVSKTTLLHLDYQAHGTV